MACKHRCMYVYQDSSARIPVAQPDPIDLGASGGRFESHVIYSSSSYRDIIIALRFHRECSSRSWDTNHVRENERLPRGNLCGSEIWRTGPLVKYAMRVGNCVFSQPRYTYCLDREVTAILVNPGREMFRAAKLLPSGNAAKYRLLEEKLGRIGKENKKRQDDS